MPIIRKASWRGLTLIQCKHEGMLTAQSGPLVAECFRSRVHHRWSVILKLLDVPDTNAPCFSASDCGPDLEAALEMALRRLLLVASEAKSLLQRAEAELETVQGAAHREFHLDAAPAPSKDAAPRKKAARKVSPSQGTL